MPEPDFKRVDFEPFFLRWNSVMFYPNPENRENERLLHGYAGEGGVIPAHQHKTCEGLVNATTKYPPRVCPHCGVDTDTELTEDERGFDPSGIRTSVIPTA